MSELGDAALDYVSRGWAVFPLVEGQKTPACENGFKDATTDPEQVEMAWSVRPMMNVGIATGDASGGLVVLDFDVDPDKGEDGIATLRAWEIAHGELPETVQAVTGRGGLHMFYRTREHIGCSINSDAGVDVRGNGGYVVAPPSIHPNGTPYAWENDPDDYEVAEADGNVLAFIRSIQPERTGRRFELPKEIKGGSRNDTLMRYACSMQARGDDDVLILSALEAANKLKCKPPLPSAEVEAIVKSITERYGKGEAKTLEARPRVTFMLSKNGGPQQTIENCTRALAADPSLAGRFFYDVRSFTKMVTLPLPWDDGAGMRPIGDADYCGLAAYLEREHGLYSKQKAIDAVVNVSMQNKRNPVAEWLDSLKWDGEPRVDTLLPCFLGCDPSDYNTAVMRLLMQGAVARAYEPGAKFDYMPVLIGAQGIGKSMFLRRLGHESAWYCDNFNTVDGDAAAEKLRGMWICEMAELLATKKQRDVESIKAFLTSTVDTIRPKYARETEQRPRACVFCGTTNDAAFLTDTTGNRRFLPVECGKFDAPMSLFADGVDDYFSQVWAEAVHVYKRDRPPLVLDARLQSYALEKQDEYTEDDPRVGMIQAYLDDRLSNERDKAGFDPMDVRVCVQELVEHALGDAYARQANSRFLINEVHKLMQSKIRGWVKYPMSHGKARCDGYGVQRCYIPDLGEVGEK